MDSFDITLINDASDYDGVPDTSDEEWFETYINYKYNTVFEEPRDGVEYDWIHMLNVILKYETDLGLDVGTLMSYPLDKTKIHTTYIYVVIQNNRDTICSNILARNCDQDTDIVRHTVHTHVTCF
jgi:hypothetical protein